MSSLMQLYHGRCNASSMNEREGKWKKKSVEHALPFLSTCAFSRTENEREYCSSVWTQATVMQYIICKESQICVDLDLLIFKWDIQHSPSPRFASNTWARYSTHGLGCEHTDTFPWTKSEIQFSENACKILKNPYGVAKATNTEANLVVPFVRKPSQS